MSCPKWEVCFHEECVLKKNCSVCSCPYVHLCPIERCKSEGVCMDASFWATYWKNKNGNPMTTPLVKSIKRKEKKKRRRTRLGKKQRNWIKRNQEHSLVYSNAPLCTKTGDKCDKHAACSVMNECIVKIPRIAGNAPLVESLRGPRSLKDIIRLLKEHDPGPMKGYYLSAGKKNYRKFGT